MEILVHIAVTLPCLIVLAVPVFFGYQALRDFLVPSRTLRINPMSPASPAQQVKDFRVALAIIFAISLGLAWLVVRFLIMPVWTLPVP